MKKQTVIKVYYIGTKFPHLYGEMVEVRDDFSVKGEYYEMRKPGEKYFAQSLPGSEFSFTKP